MQFFISAIIIAIRLLNASDFFFDAFHAQY